jgi:hypothetical protein
MKERPIAIRFAAEQLIPDQMTDRESIAHLINFLLKLPSAEEQEKILNRLIAAGARHHILVDNFNWWDIMSGELWLFADIHRDHTRIRVSFTWKAVHKGTPSHMISQHKLNWARDTAAPDGWRFEFTFNEYHDMIGGFKAWLEQPLPPRPV